MERLFPGRQAPVFYESCLDSTNRLLKEWAVQGAAHGTVLIAGRQTGGRGRLGRSFVSPEGGLYLSVLFRPACSLEQAASLSALAALAVCRAVRAVAAAEPGIKWPNDVVLNGKKLCGILAESVLGSDGARLVVGIGVNGNLRLEDFPEELRQTAGSLLTETGKRVDLRVLAERLIREMPKVEVTVYQSRVPKELTEQYETVLKNYDCGALVGLTKSIYAKKISLQEQKRKFGTVDERFLKRAENLLFGELAAALEIPKEQVQEYIESKLAAG